MNFLERILDGLHREPGRLLLQEAWSDRVERATAGELLARVALARRFLRRAGLRPGDRCVLLAANSIRWVAADLAIMAEGLVRVPLYTRQSPAELVGMMRDCEPALIVCGDDLLRAAVQELWPEAPVCLLSEVGAESAGGAATTTAAPGAASTATVAADTPPLPRRAQDPLVIIYTSGTSGDSKGVVLTTGNVDHMLPCTLQRLDELMHGHAGQERVFHYLPFCFAGSWLLLLSSLSRRSLLTMATDIDKLQEQLRLASPHYFQNVPLLLERLRAGIDKKLQASAAGGLYRRARVAWAHEQDGRAGALDHGFLALADAVLFRRVRRKISPDLRALICGSAPLAEETQGFFEMLRIPVLQVYGLTETTAICTMDEPRGRRRPGRVGRAVPGIEMRLGENDEILVRGPHLFAGYWKRPAETAACMQDGWFRTGDQGEVDAGGLWRISGRIKNLLVLTSGHKVAPDPLEERLRLAVPQAQQVLVVGHQRQHLTAILTGEVTAAQVTAALERLNSTLPHYQRVHAFHIEREPFTAESGLLTANGKIKRQRVLDRFAAALDALYAAPVAPGATAGRGAGVISSSGRQA
jgi:long-chain acyl-CoA synthetase